jgi:hypothetical protein
VHDEESKRYLADEEPAFVGEDRVAFPRVRGSSGDSPRHSARLHRGNGSGATTSELSSIPKEKLTRTRFFAIR